MPKFRDLLFGFLRMNERCFGEVGSFSRTEINHPASAFFQRQSHESPIILILEIQLYESIRR